MDLLNSKLRAPKRHNSLYRKRLIRLFEDICQNRLIAVTAGAGYGKTTLVMDALEKMDVVPLWYRLDEQDTDFPVFISYLYSAVQHHFPPPNGVEKGHGIPKTGLKKQTETLLEWLAFLEKIVTCQTVLVLDDYHLVQESRQINHAIDFILARLPDNIHLVIIGRKDLTLRLSTLRAREQLIEISEEDLSFTTDEIKLFFTDTLLPSDTQIKEIHSTTGGWAASLVLLRYTFHKKAPETIVNSLELFKQTPKYIFPYLKENIFDTQPAHIKEFMMKAALLAEIDTRRCSRIFDVDNADTILKKMIEDHLMIFPVDESGKIFYLHHLFRDFLITQLEETFSKPDIHQLHCRIARETEDDDVFQALNHFIEGHAFDEAIRIIKSHEMKFLLKGKINFLGQCLKKIPESIIEDNPQLLLAQAKLFTHFGKPRVAMEYLTRAHKLFKKQESKKDMVKCLVELGSQYYFTGYIKEAKLLMEQVLDDVEKKSSTFTIIMAYLTLLSSVLGEFKTAENYYKMAWEEIDAFPDFERRLSKTILNISYTYILYIRGNFEQALQLNKKVLKAVLELDIEIFLPIVYHNRSSISCFFEAFEEGFEYASKGIAICEKISLMDSQKAWVYLTMAQSCFGLGKQEQAIEFVDCSIELFEEPGNRWGLAHAWGFLHTIYLAQGKIDPARQVLNRAIDIIDGYGLISTEGLLENSLAALLMVEKDFPKALECLDSARAKLEGVDFDLFNNHMLTSKSYFKSNRLDEAIKHLSHGLFLSESKTYDRFVKKEAHWIVPLLKSALSKGVTLKEKPGIYLKNIIKNDMERCPLQLKIALLGQFKLTIDGKDIPSSKWKSSKALVIFKYLAANRHKGFIPREVLIEMLWPDEDMRKTGSRFNMAMSALRKTLEPDLSAKAASAYIERKKDMYRLYFDTSISIDSEQFSEALISAKAQKNNPQKALESYLLAHSLYQGTFLEEDLYEDWCMEKKEQFAADHLMMLRAIVDIYDAQNNIDNAVLYTKEILEADPFDENALKKLMTFHAESGNLSKIKKIYLNYKKVSAEMDCPVSPAITELYELLIKKNNSV